MLSILFALTLTLFLEGLVYALCFKFEFKTLVAVSIANILINTFMNFTITSLVSYKEYMIWLMMFEVLTFITEAIVCFIFSKGKLWFCFLAAFTANIVSFAVGYTFNYFNLFKENGTLIIGSTILFVLYTGLIVYSALRFFTPWLFVKQNGQDDTKSQETSETNSADDNANNGKTF